MLKKTIKYENADGQEVTGDFYFHINKAELIEMEMSKDGGFAKHIERVIAAEDGRELYAALKEVVLLAFGEKNGDGFVKSDEARKRFESSDAFGNLILELATDGEAGIAFVNGVVPKGLEKELAKIKKKNDKEAAKAN